MEPGESNVAEIVQCKKLRNGEQMFGNINQQSPPLSLYPSSQRVTYLYYLGRYLFANNHFFRAQLALQAAYDQCHTQFQKQRRLILVYLVSSNIILGRFPSQLLLNRPEAQGLAERFLPICRAISKGDLTLFRKSLDIENDQAAWFLRKRILLQLRNRCEILVWRSLARRTYLLNGSEGNVSKNFAPSFSLMDLQTLAALLEATGKPSNKPNGLLHTNAIFMQKPPEDKATKTYQDPDFGGASDDEDEEEYTQPTTMEIEAIVASLVDQGLMHGYIAHEKLRFAIQGAKTQAALQAGFPNVWQTIKNQADETVPGWVLTSQKPAGAGGMVFNLSNVRPVGVDV